MGGYSCLRKSSIKGKEVSGVVTIPSSYAGLCPGDFDGNQIKNNIVPEIFFGYYCPKGIDIGIRIGGGGGWRPFCYGNNYTYINDSGKSVTENICSGTQDGTIFSTTKVKPGTSLYMRTWLEKVGSQYYAKINVSTTGYSGTDLMGVPLAVKVLSKWAEIALRDGCDINREITIAANPSSYETSGAYMTKAKWGECKVVSATGKLIPWDDSNSLTFTGLGATKGASGTYVLQLRKDGSTYSSSRIKVDAVTNAAGSGATETVSIDFRSTPKI